MNRLYHGGTKGGLYLGAPRWTTPDTYTQLLYTFDEIAGEPFQNTGLAGSLDLSHISGSESAKSWSSIFTRGIRFNGNTNGVVSAKTSVGETAGAWTASIWVYPLSFGSNYSAFFGKQYRNDDSWSDPFQSLQMQWTDANNGSWQAQTTIGGTAHTIDLGALDQRLVLNKWQHIALTSDGSLLSAYKDGTLMSAISISGATDWNNHGRWFFGGNNASADSTYCVIDDARFEWTARSLAYLKSQYDRAVGW